MWLVMAIAGLFIYAGMDLAERNGKGEVEDGEPKYLLWGLGLVLILIGSTIMQAKAYNDGYNEAVLEHGIIVE